MKTYGVLVVDDSALMRKSISALIESHPEFYVIGKARNGIDALEKIKTLRPALVTMDVEMPEMNGIEAVQHIMERNPVAVIVIANERAQQEAAMQYGAVDFLLKKYVFEEQELSEFHERLTKAMKVKLRQPVLEEETIIVEEPHVESDMELLIIGASTGGPTALQKVIQQMEPHFPVPVFIIQHMPPGFTKSLATRFNHSCAITVKEAEDHEVLQRGVVYIAPAGLQSSILRNKGGSFTVKLHDKTEVETLYHPSIDVALLSIASSVKNGLVSVILTGMGDDGLRGCQEVKRYGGRVIVEAEESCVVYGMPKVVAHAGYADVQVPINEVFSAILNELNI
ncbi:hypothetical protein A6K76_06410 [Caryophanon latum]|uniref:Protein-glutamate methylesterase/protein-glutamine glutaminase n=2 Tax=Caryophanon latum TaxID=33977 RepID=A0A1C0YZP8_9BACL|nr:hypothetical protein A6K76_06410 [Caryophanon latum]